MVSYVVQDPTRAGREKVNTNVGNKDRSQKKDRKKEGSITVEGAEGAGGSSRNISMAQRKKVEHGRSLQPAKLKSHQENGRNEAATGEKEDDLRNAQSKKGEDCGGKKAPWLG